MIMSDYFKEYGFDFDEEIIKDFCFFTDYLLSENEKYNLTSITVPDEIIIKHYIDSVIILKYFDIPENSRIIDIGTGAGFPALPLALIRKDLRITFLDSSNKKINFIKNALTNLNLNSDRDLDLSRFDFYCGRAEDLCGDIKIRESYDFALSRAVAKLNILCELSAAFISPGGFFIAYKGKNAYDEISSAKNALKILGLKIENITEFNLSDKIDKIENSENKRVLVKIKKLKKTSPKYPRNFSDITKNPL